MTWHQHKDSKCIGSKILKMHDAYWTTFWVFVSSRPIDIAHFFLNEAISSWTLDISAPECVRCFLNTMRYRNKSSPVVVWTKSSSLAGCAGGRLFYTHRVISQRACREHDQPNHVWSSANLATTGSPSQRTEMPATLSKLWCSICSWMSLITAVSFSSCTQTSSEKWE